MKKSRPVLLLDVMDTLVVDPFRVHIPAFFGLTLAELLAQKHPTAWVEFEKGQLDEAAYAARMFADGRFVDHEALARHVRAAYAFIDGVEELLSELHAAGVEMHALSNYPVWYRMLEERLDLSRYLSWRFVSCNTGLRKPHPEAYLSAARSRRDRVRRRSRAELRGRALRGHDGRALLLGSGAAIRAFAPGPSALIRRVFVPARGTSGPDAPRGGAEAPPPSRCDADLPVR